MSTTWNWTLKKKKAILSVIILVPDQPRTFPSTAVIASKILHQWFQNTLLMISAYGLQMSPNIQCPELSHEVVSFSNNSSVLQVRCAVLFPFSPQNTQNTFYIRSKKKEKKQAHHKRKTFNKILTQHRMRDWKTSETHYLWLGFQHYTTLNKDTYTYPVHIIMKSSYCKIRIIIILPYFCRILREEKRKLILNYF